MQCPGMQAGPSPPLACMQPLQTPEPTQQQSPASPGSPKGVATPSKEEEDEEDRRWQQMVARREAEGAPLRPRRSRFEARHEAGLPMLAASSNRNAKRARASFWEQSTQLEHEQARSMRGASWQDPIRVVGRCSLNHHN